MKKQILTIVCIGSIYVSAYAQNQPPQGNPPFPNTNARAAAAWYRGGNNNIPANNFNIFGTLWNSPIYTQTNGINRHKLNGEYTAFPLQYQINGYVGGPGVNNINTSGYMLLGHSQGFSQTLFNNRGAFSMLHLNGRDGTFVQDGGFRPWMKTGVTLTDNNDLSYFGLRQVGNGNDVTETTITWSDNAGGGVGPDAMVFRFTSAGNGNANISNDLTVDNDLDGRHIARFMPTGEFGLGNTFGVGSGLYTNPRSLLHLSLNDRENVWSQYTNQGSGQTQNNGLRIGLLGGFNNQQNGNALVYNQGNKHLLFSTGVPTNAATAQNPRERMRVTSVSAPTTLGGGGYGVNNPGNIPNNRTRVSISHDPNNPVTRPLSLVHIGYNTGSQFNPNTTDGWRPWMDVGTFTARNSDNMYVGLKAEGNDRFDAVVNWGDNQAPGISGPVGPDHLRFIFTSTTTALPPGQGDPVSQSADGLEVARMDPSLASTLPNTNFGMMGIGNFSPTGPNAAAALQPDAKLDIDGDLRIRTVENDNSLTQILAIDPNDLNRVKWVDISLPPPGTGIGNYCPDPQNPLIDDFEVPLNNFNYHFTDPTTPLNEFENTVVIGRDCNAPKPGKLNVYRDATINTQFFIEGAVFENSDIAQSVVNSGLATSVHGITNAHNRENSGITGESENGQNNIGGDFFARGIYNPSTQQNLNNTGTRCIAVNALVNIGVQGLANDNLNQNSDNFGGAFNASGQSANQNYGIQSIATGTDANQNFGVYGLANGGNTVNYSIYGIASTSLTSTNWAGYFNGQVNATGGFTTLPSDLSLKTNIDTLYDANALNIINGLNPVLYEYNQNVHPHINFMDGKHMGFIAQEVEQIYPNAVKDIIHPAEYDSTGNIINPQVNYKGLMYQEFIPLAIKGIKIQQSQIDSLENEIASRDSLLDDVNNRLTQLENCLSNILPLLCQINNTAIETNDEQTQENLIKSLNVELFDGENIVLEQNIPNPFAERTVINYYLPESVNDAKLLFYNQQGKVIREIPLNDRGNGRVNVFGAELSNGTYSYTLICDGQVISTKTMVKTY